MEAGKMDVEKKLCPLFVENIKPYFIWQFGIKLPENLKPIKTAIKGLLGEDGINDVEIPLDSSNKLNKINEEEPILYDRYGLICEHQCKGGCRNFTRLAMDINRLAKTPCSRGEFNSYWSSNPKITWLSNDGKRESEIIGLSLKGLEEIDRELYQIGMQSTSSKEYFKYLSVTDKRKVNIRMVLFNYHRRINNAGCKRRLGDFFTRFNHFEEQLQGNYETMTFHLDEYGDRFFRIRTLDGVELIDESFGFDLDFNNWLKEIETGQNKE
jgi:hypothetical protein